MYNSKFVSSLRTAYANTPRGQYQVDADALRKARQGTPDGEYHAA